jgi:hypothetical protein
LHGNGGIQLFEEVFSKPVESEGIVQSREMRAKKKPERRDPERSKVKFICCKIVKRVTVILPGEYCK